VRVEDKRKTTILHLIFIHSEGVFGPRWAVLDLRLLGWWWTVVLGCSWAATAGKVQVGFSSLFPFSVFIFCFIIQF
jgi:hypothetical protein